MFDILKKKNIIKSSFKAMAARKYQTKTKYLGSWFPYTCIKEYGVWLSIFYHFFLRVWMIFPVQILIFTLLYSLLTVSFVKCEASNETDNY